MVLRHLGRFTFHPMPRDNPYWRIAILSRYPSLDHRKLEFPAFGQQRAGSAVGF